MPNYLRSEALHDPEMTARLRKPIRGQRVIDKEDDDREALKRERAVKALVKVRDSWTCRWPETHVCRKGLECAHVKDASLGGPMETFNLILVCGWLHRRGPESIHGKQLKVEPESRFGTNGPCSFWRKGEDGEYYLVARELRPGVIEKD